jgi:hypothetical protein
MSNAATESKQRWNASHYTQVKVAVKPEIASAFRATCAAANVSMAGQLSQFMADYSNTIANRKTSPDYSTKRKRRAAIQSIVMQLQQIKDAEERYRDNIPDNLQASVVYETAEQCVSLLDEAAELIDSIY